jgi:hypothetical protein
LDYVSDYGSRVVAPGSGRSAHPLDRSEEQEFSSHS